MTIKWPWEEWPPKRRPIHDIPNPCSEIVLDGPELCELERGSGLANIWAMLVVGEELFGPAPVPPFRVTALAQAWIDLLKAMVGM